MHISAALALNFQIQAQNHITFVTIFVIACGLSECRQMPDLLFIDSDTSRCEHNHHGGKSRR